MKNRIATLRKNRNWSQQELANKVGVSRFYISKIETGHKPGSIQIMAKIANALGVSLDDIFLDNSVTYSHEKEEESEH